MSVIKKKKPDARKIGDENNIYRIRRSWRSKKAVDQDEVWEMAVAGMSDRDIAKAQGVSEDTLHNNFSELIDRGRVHFELAFKKKQIDKALGTTTTGDTQLLIHLGKCRLKQRENEPEESTNKCMASTLFEVWNKDAKKVKDDTTKQ